MSLFKATNHYCKVQVESEVENVRKGVLIVDDSKFSRNILNDMLKAEGYLIVGEAQDGLEAIDMAREKRPEFVFLDVEMPKLDGIGAISKILEVDPEIKIIMCTALGQKNVILEAAKAGAKDYVIKPYLKENIIGVLKLVSEKKQKDRQVIPFKPGKKNQEEINNNISFNEKQMDPIPEVKEQNLDALYRSSIDMTDLLDPLEFEEDSVAEDSLESLLDSESLLGNIEEEVLESYVNEETLNVLEPLEAVSENESEEVLELENEAELESGSEIELLHESEAELNPDTEAQLEPENQTELKTEVELQPETEAELKDKTEVELDQQLDSEAELKVETEVELEQQLDSEVELKNETEVESQPESEAVLDADSEAELKDENKVELESQTEVELETETEAELKPVSEAETEQNTESQETILNKEIDEETEEIAELLEAMLNDEKTDEEEIERAKFVEAILREESLDLKPEGEANTQEAIVKDEAPDTKPEVEANTEEAIVKDEAPDTKPEGEANPDEAIVNEEASVIKPEGEANLEEAIGNGEASDTKTEGEANPEEAIADGEAIVNGEASDTMIEGEANPEEAIINGEATVNEEATDIKAEGETNPEETISNEKLTDTKTEEDVKLEEAIVNDELTATKAEEVKLEEVIENEEIIAANAENEGKSEEPIGSKEVPVDVYLFMDTLQNDTSDSDSYTYLWNNRFDLLQKEFKFQKKESQRVSFYEYAYLETDRDNIFGNYYANREMLLGIMNAYMPVENRLQLADTANFELKTITYPKEIRLFTSNILEESSNEFTEVTIMNAIKYNSLKPKLNSQEITNKTGFYQVVSDFVSGKSGRVLR